MGCGSVGEEAPSCKVVCSHKKKGGLGIRNLSILNRALLCKWSWRFAVERESFWKLIISRKFGKKVEGGIPVRLGSAMGWGFGRKLERKAF